MGGGKINRKTIAISLILLTTLAVAVGALTITAFATADTNSTTTNTGTAVTSDTSQNIDQAQFESNMIMDNQGFGAGPGGHGGRGGGFMGGMANIEVSSEYTANVNAILNNDTDVQNLISQGYNVTSINPVIKNVIEGDGTFATKATTAVVMMQNGTSGYATVNVDVTNAKVTEIVTITKTVIDKSSS